MSVTPAEREVEAHRSAGAAEALAKAAMDYLADATDERGIDVVRKRCRLQHSGQVAFSATIGARGS